MKDYVLTITLNPAIDKTVTIPNFKIGKDFREKAMSISAGGKGINVSQVLKHLGTKTIASGFLGACGGNYISKELDKEKISHGFVPISNSTRTSLTIIDSKSNTITRLLERGPLVTKKELKAFQKKFESLLKYSQCVIFSGRNIPGAPHSFYAELIERAKRKKVLTVLDTSGKPYKLALLKKPFMIKPNLEEVEQILGKKTNSASKIKEAAFHFYKTGIEITAITMGSRGAVVFDGNEMLEALPPKLKRKNPVGCGDAFIGGFVASYIDKKDFTECVRMAVSCGAANALSINPGSIKSGAIKKIYRQVKIINA